MSDYYSQSDKDNIYLPIMFRHDKSKGNQATPAEYSQQLNIPFLYRPSQYYCSVVSLTVPLATIPLMIFPVLATQTDPTVGSMILGIRHTGINYPINVKYVPTGSQPAPLPHAGPIYFTNKESNNPYYWVFFISHVVNMFNKAIADAMTAAGLGAIVSPYFTFDPTTQLFSLHTVEAFRLSGAELYQNQETNNYLNSFNLYYRGFNQPQGRDFSYILDPVPPGSPVAGPYTYIEDYNTIDLWFALRKLIVTSNLPLNNEIVPTQNSQGIDNGLTSSQPIVTDFTPQLEFANQSRSIAYYNPTAQYKLIDMTSDTPLSRLGFTLHWQDKQGNIYPLLLSVGQSADLKVGFFKKHLYHPAVPLLK
jgi:hypothetical protein